jgi:hypothetical protein
MYGYVPLTTWFTGLLNGIQKRNQGQGQEQGLPNSIIYSVMGTSTFISMIKATANLDVALKTVTPRQAMAGIFIVVPMITGATFFLGDQMGQALRYTEDQKKGVKFSLV